MPKSVQVSEEERVFLRKAIEEKFDLKINSANDCELLSKIIYKEANLLISYNTLRRFFKILPNSNFPSLYTVNLLSTIIGFNDFNELRDYRVNLNRDFIHENLHLFNVSKEINVDILNEVIPLLKEDHWENIYQTRTLIELFIKKDKTELISIFFNNDIEESNWEKMYKYYVAFQPIHAAAKLNNKSLISFVKNNINSSKIVQQVLLQLYVEEDCLDGYYGEWINACNVYLTSDMQVFYTCMSIQYHYLKKEVDVVKNLICSLNVQVENHKHKIHPIVLGRIAAWNFIVNEDSSYLEKYISNVLDKSDNISTLTFFYRLVYLFGTKKQFIKFDYITVLQTQDLQYINIPFNNKTELSMYYLILTRYYVETEAKSLASKTIQHIDIRYQFSCSSDFFVKEYELLNKTIKGWD
jgi:hypothetical protein